MLFVGNRGGIADQLARPRLGMGFFYWFGRPTTLSERIEVGGDREMDEPTVRLLTTDDTPQDRAVCLRALTEHPEAFGSAAEEFEQQSFYDIDWMIWRLQ